MSYGQAVLSKDVSYAPVSNDRIADLETSRVIFFAGDAIPPNEKYEMPDIKGFGGIYLPHVMTLPQGTAAGARGMVYQCKLTQLKTFRKSEWANMLSPEARKSWDSSYVTTDNEGRMKTVPGFLESNLTAAKKGRFETEYSDHIVHKHLYPGDDIRMATARSLPNGVGGVVEIAALKGASQAEIDEVQYFFFPNWDTIAQGLDDLPKTIDGVENLIKTRTAEIVKQGWDAEKVAKYKRISMDMLRSCMEFRRTGSQIIEKDDAAFKTASKMDTSQGYSSVSTHLLDQLKIQRKGDLLAGDHSAMHRLAEAMESERAGDNSLESKKLLLEERKLYLEAVKMGIQDRDIDEEVRLGLAKPKAPVQVESTPDVSVMVDTVETPVEDVDIRLCGQPKANGEPCQRELKDGETACFQHVG